MKVKHLRMEEKLVEPDFLYDGSDIFDPKKQLKI